MICKLCPNKCGVDRNQSLGFCGESETIKIAKFYRHKFEEPPISGTNGSGTVFFTGCSLKCVFCQNFELSRSMRGKDITIKELADIFKALELDGAHNINLVNPTHYSDKIIRALDIYKPNIPIVYNTHGFEDLDALKSINDYIDIYLPDMKYFSPILSKRYSGKENYFEVASKAIEFMLNKKTTFDKDGLQKSGVIVRHLVLPLCTDDSIKILDWFSNIKDCAFINVMSQYTPFGNLDKFPEINRKITKREYDKVINYAMDIGIENMYYQKLQSASTDYIPTWDY